MRIRVLGCSGGSAPGREPSCYLLDGGVSIDAGALASALPLEEQRNVTDVFLTHSHWDHVRDLPLSVINRGPDSSTLRVHGLAVTIEAIRTHVMNDVIWFEAFDLPSADTPYVEALTIAAGETRECGPYRLTAVPLPHTVPAIGYLVDDGEAAVLFCSDTGGGGALRSLPAGGSPLRGVVLETSFPNRMREFAKLTGHLTPAMLGEECAHFGADVRVFATHMKPGYEDELREELEALDRPGVQALRDGDVLEF